MVDYQAILESIIKLYETMFYDIVDIPVSILITEDMNKTHAELRPDRANALLTDNVPNNANGRMVAPISLNGDFYILLNENRIIEYSNDGSWTWIGTVAHELTHAMDYYQMGRKEGIVSYSELEDLKNYRMFNCWTEFHARKRGYRLLREYLEIVNLLPKDKDYQIGQIIEEEAPGQTKCYRQKIEMKSPYDRLDFTMQYLGRFSVWMDLFPGTINVNWILNYFSNDYQLIRLFFFLHSHETLNSVYGNFDKLERIISDDLGLFFE